MGDIIIIGIACTLCIIIGHIGGYKSGKATRQHKVSIIVPKEQLTEYTQGDKKPMAVYVDGILAETEIVSVKQKDKETKK